MKRKDLVEGECYRAKAGVCSSLRVQVVDLSNPDRIRVRAEDGRETRVFASDLAEPWALHELHERRYVQGKADVISLRKRLVRDGLPHRVTRFRKELACDLLGPADVELLRRIPASAISTWFDSVVTGCARDDVRDLVDGMGLGAVLYVASMNGDHGVVTVVYGPTSAQDAVRLVEAIDGIDATFCTRLGWQALRELVESFDGGVGSAKPTSVADALLG